MSSAHGIRMKKPVHPGRFVKHEIIEALDLSVTGAARALGVTRAALSAVLNERARLSPEMALRIEKAFGVSMDTLMRMQRLSLSDWTATTLPWPARGPERSRLRYSRVRRPVASLARSPLLKIERWFYWNSCSGPRHRGDR